MKIFQRTHRGVALTAHGERVIAIAEEMVENNRQLLNLFAEHRAHPAEHSAGGLSQRLQHPEYLTARLRACRDEPTLSMREVMSTKVVSSVANGMANIRVGASARHEFFNSQYSAHNNGFTFEPVYTDHFCLCVSRTSHFGGNASADVSELKEEHLAVTDSHPISSTSSGGHFEVCAPVLGVQQHGGH